MDQRFSVLGETHFLMCMWQRDRYWKRFEFLYKAMDGVFKVDVVDLN